MSVPSNPSALPLVQESATSPPPTPYRSANGGTTQGQTLYIRAVQRTFLHRCSLLVNLLVIIGAIGLVFGQIWGMAIKNMTLMEIIMRSYLIAFAGLVILNECEALAVLKNSPIMNMYPWRGLFYTFMGALGTMLNDLGNDDYRNNWNSNRYNYNNGYNNDGGYVTFQLPSLEHAVEIFIEITSIQLFFMGCLYFILGCCFMQKKVERDIEAYRMQLALCERNFGGLQDAVRRSHKKSAS